jgi:hypothetical protein
VSAARHAARLYARERCALPARIIAAGYDGFRHLRQHGSWNSSGVTWDALWLKYEAQIRRELGGGADEAAVRDAVCLRILEKSCCTNQMFDRIAGMSAAAQVQAAAAQAAAAEAEEALRAVAAVRRKFAAVGKRVMREPLAVLTSAPALSGRWRRSA